MIKPKDILVSKKVSVPRNLTFAVDCSKQVKALLNFRGRQSGKASWRKWHCRWNLKEKIVVNKARWVF